MLDFRRLIPVLGALALGGGCNCGKKQTSQLQAQSGIPSLPSALNFGNVEIGQTVRLELQLGNTGAGSLDVDNQSVSGAAFSESTPLAQTTLPVGGNTTATLAFTPMVAGPAAGTFTLDSDGNPSTVSVALVGVGLDLNLTATPASLSFGKVQVGTTATPQTVTLLNTTSAPFYVEVASSGTAPEYKVTDAQGQPVTGAPLQLAPNTPYVVTVGFVPDLVSIFNSSFALTACQDAAATVCLPPQAIPLSGQGVSGHLTLTPNPIAFNGVPNGSTADQTVVVANTGNAAVKVTCLSLESQGATACGTSSAIFTLGAPSVTLPTVLDAGSSFSFPLTYQSAGSTTVTDVLNATYVPVGLTAATVATDDITASQSAAPCALGVSPSSLFFTYSTLGTQSTESVALTNAGGTACQITGIALGASSDPGYSLPATQPLALTVPIAGSATVSVTFAFMAAGVPNTRLGELDLQSSDPLLPSVRVPLQASVQTSYAGNGAWPRWHHDNTQSGLTANDTSWLAGTVAWTVPVGVPPAAGTHSGFYFPVYDYLNSPVVGSDGTIYQLGMLGELYAVSPDGGVEWTAALQGTVFDPHPGTPIIAADGTIFVAFGDISLEPGETTGMYHFASDGGLLQSFAPVAPGDGFDLPPMFTNGGLLLGADDFAGGFGFQGGTTGYTLSLQASALTRGSGSQGDQMSAVVGPDDSTYWCGGGICTGLSTPAAGFKPVWGPLSPNSTGSATSDLALDELFTGNLMVLFGGWGYDTGQPGTAAQQLISLSPLTGDIVWKVTLPAPTAAQEESIYFGIADASVGNSCPAIGTDGTIYVGNFDGLHAFDGATGTEKTGFPFATTSTVLTAPAIGGDGTIFFGTADGTFYALKPSGAVRFTVHAGGRIAGSPAIGPSGVVYFTADDGNLYAVN